MPGTNEYAPPPLAPEVRATVRGRKKHRQPAQPRASRPSVDTAASAADAAAILRRLEPGDELLVRLRKTADDLKRWQETGLPAILYRTPDGEILLDPVALLAGLATHPAAVVA